MAKFYWTTNGIEKIKQSKIQSMVIGKKVEETDNSNSPVLEWMVFPVINNKVYNHPIADGMECEEEARAWINQNFT